MTRNGAQTFALSAGEAVLGLVIERPGNSYQLERRLEGRFGSAQFAHGTAYHAVRRLSKKGFIRAVDGDRSALPARAEAGSSRATAYEATAEGIEHFERWLRASTSTPPVREELLAKIAFCGPADLPRMVEIVREAELTCAARLEDLNERMRRERRLLGDDEWRRTMGIIATAGDAAWWDARIKWLQALRQYMQREVQRHETGRGPGQSGPGGQGPGQSGQRPGQGLGQRHEAGQGLWQSGPRGLGQAGQGPGQSGPGGPGQSGQGLGWGSSSSLPRA